MKSVIKKGVSVLLCLVLVLSVLTPVVLAQENAEGTDIPMIYVLGSGCPLYVREPDGSKRKVYPIPLEDDFISRTVKENIGVFAKAVLTQKWDEFSDVLVDILVPLYAEIKLDENGEAPNGSVCNWTWSKDQLDGSRINGKYPTNRFTFQYDFRMDPYKTADILRQYIEDVREVTGADQVALCGRCLGSCICAAYMEKYDGEYISDFIIYAAALKGATQCTKAFAGELYLDSDGVERYVYDLQLFADETLNALFQSFVTLFNKMYGLDIACWSVNNVYPDIYLKIVPRMLVDTLASFPGYWSMVADEDYAKAKETVFYGADAEKYAHFIEIIDNYHYNVQVPAEENFKAYAARGIEFANITKYGFQTIPITEEADVLSDQLCTVTQASMGAITAPVNGTFSKQYLTAAAANGTDRFISPDLQVDASTCFAPERTWFIKNMAHTNFSSCVHGLMDSIINNDGYTVFTDPTYPQYMVYDENAAQVLFPMTAENGNTTARYHVTFFSALKTFLVSAWQVIKNYLASNKG